MSNSSLYSSIEMLPTNGIRQDIHTASENIRASGGQPRIWRIGGGCMRETGLHPGELVLVDSRSLFRGGDLPVKLQPFIGRLVATAWPDINDVNLWYRQLGFLVGLSEEKVIISPTNHSESHGLFEIPSSTAVIGLIIATDGLGTDVQRILVHSPVE